MSTLEIKGLNRRSGSDMIHFSGVKSKKGIQKLSYAGGLLSVAMLVKGYEVSLTIGTNSGKLGFMLPSVLSAALVFVGSLLFFENFFPLALMRLKGRIKLSGFSHVIYRIRARANMLCLPALLCAPVLTIASHSLSIGGSYAFWGVLLEMLFLLITCSMLYFSQIIEATEEMLRYNGMKKVGKSIEEVRRLVALKMGMLFGMPLLAGLVNSIFSILAYSRILGPAGNKTTVLVNASIAAVIYAAVYCVYYALSVSSCMKIVCGKNSIRN